MEAEIHISPVITPQVGLILGLKHTLRPLRFVAYFLVATLLPLFALLLYLEYAVAHGINVEKGCEGPGIPFSFVSGILYALQLRFFEIHKSHD